MCSYLRIIKSKRKNGNECGRNTHGNEVSRNLRRKKFNPGEKIQLLRRKKKIPVNIKNCNGI